MKKLLFVAMSSAALILAACGDDKKTTTEPEQVEEVKVDLTEQATAYKTNVLVELTALVEDTKKLQAKINEGNLEDASKLYPIVHMSIEKMKPLEEQFKSSFELIDGALTNGKELEGKGIHVIEHSLFTLKDVNAAKDAATSLVADTTEFANEVAKATVDGKLVLDSTKNMINRVVQETLANSEASVANTEVYDTKASVDGVAAVVEVFASKASEKEVEALKATLTAVNEEIAFYEIGKEDYVAYNLFTNKQKQQLIEKITQLQSDFTSFINSIQ